MTQARTSPVEGHLVGVPVAAGVHLQPVEVVAGLQVDDAALGVQPVEPRLARHAAVLGPDDALGDAVGQKRRGVLVRADRGVQVLDERGLIVVEHGLPLRLGPLLEGLRAAAEGLAGLRIDRARRRRTRARRPRGLRGSACAPRGRRGTPAGPPPSPARAPSCGRAAGCGGSRPAGGSTGNVRRLGVVDLRCLAEEEAQIVDERPALIAALAENGGNGHSRVSFTCAAFTAGCLRRGAAGVGRAAATRGSLRGS